MVFAVREEQERTVSRGGNSALLYLPREYFTPGEKVGYRLEIDPDGNLRVTLTKRLFNFTCEDVKLVIGTELDVEYDKTIAGTRVLGATRGGLSLYCTKSTRDLEPTHVTVSRRFEWIRSPGEYASLTTIVRRLRAQNLDAYMEPEGDLDSIDVFRNPQKHGLRSEAEAIEALHATGRRIGLSIVVRFDSKENGADQVGAVIGELRDRASP